MQVRGPWDDVRLSERWKGLDLRLLPIDEVDVKILTRLRESARLRNVEIARALGISEATIRRRIRALEEKGIIMGYSCYLNYQLIENPVKAYVHISTEGSAGTRSCRKSSPTAGRSQCIALLDPTASCV